MLPISCGPCGPIYVQVPGPPGSGGGGGGTLTGLGNPNGVVNSVIIGTQYYDLTDPNNPGQWIKSTNPTPTTGWVNLIAP
jgi:hypothetical protein